MTAHNDSTSKTTVADDFVGQRQRRIDKVIRLNELGFNPYPAHSQKDYPNKQIIDEFNSFEGNTVVLAGRLTSWRDHGKLIFADLLDQSGKIQLWFKEDALQANFQEAFLAWDQLELLDIQINAFIR